MFVYTMQPVVQPFVKPVEQSAACERLNVGLHESKMLNLFNRLNILVYTIQLVVQPVVKPVGTWTVGCIVYANIQPVV